MEIKNIGDAFKSRIYERKIIEECEKIIYEQARHLIHKTLEIAEKENFFGLTSRSILRRINQNYEKGFELSDIEKVLDIMFISNEIGGSDNHYRFGSKINDFKP